MAGRQRRLVTPHREKIRRQRQRGVRQGKSLARDHKVQHDLVTLPTVIEELSAEPLASSEAPWKGRLKRTESTGLKRLLPPKFQPRITVVSPVVFNLPSDVLLGLCLVDADRPDEVPSCPAVLVGDEPLHLREFVA